MPRGQKRGRFSLDCWWRNAVGEGEPDHIDYDDDMDRLRRQAEALMRGGRYRYACLYRHDGDRWSEINEFAASPERLA